MSRGEQIKYLSVINESNGVIVLFLDIDAELSLRRLNIIEENEDNLPILQSIIIFMHCGMVAMELRGIIHPCVLSQLDFLP